MRRIFDDPIWRTAIDRAGAATIAALLSPEAISLAMQERLRRIALSRRSQIGGRGALAFCLGRRARGQSQVNVISNSVIWTVTCDVIKYIGYYICRHTIYGHFSRSTACGDS